MTGGNVTQAARLAQRNRTEFYKLLQRHQPQPFQKLLVLHQPPPKLQLRH